jgi:LacI family transcriptional regulator
VRRRVTAQPQSSVLCLRLYSPAVVTTLKDVAREACVSMASVSRALNGTGIVRDEIRTRVLEVAARLNYIPNSGAQSLMSRRTRMIGVLLPKFHGEFFSELIRGIDAAARARRLHLLVSTAHDDIDETGEALRAMIGRVDGLAMLACRWSISRVSCVRCRRCC